MHVTPWKAAPASLTPTPNLSLTPHISVPVPRAWGKEHSYISVLKAGGNSQIAGMEKSESAGFSYYNCNYSEIPHQGTQFAVQWLKQKLTEVVL